MLTPVPISRERLEEALQVARSIADGSIEVIVGARKMAAIHLYSGHVQQPTDEDYALLLAIDSETEHLPIGDARRHWSPAALERKAPEVAEAETFYRERGVAAARSFIARHESGA